MLACLLRSFLYLDGYKSLWAKYKDPYRHYRTERHWAIDNYRQYFNRAFKAFDFTTCGVLRYLKRNQNYIALYNVMVDMDNNLDAIIPGVNGRC